MRQQHYRFAHQVFFHKVYSDPEGWWRRLTNGQTADVGMVWVEAGEGLSTHELISADLRLDRVTSVPGVDAMVITLPTPLNPTEAHYVAVCRNPNGGAVRYFVLENGVPADNGRPRAFWSEWRGAPGGGVMRIRGQDVDPITPEAFLTDIADELTVQVSVQGGGGGGGGASDGAAPGFRSANMGSRPTNDPLLLGGALIVPIIVGVLLHVLLSATSTTLFFVLRDTPDTLAMLGSIGTISFGCGFLTDLLIGFTYAFMHKRKEGVTVGKGAAGGAVAGAVAHILAGGGASTSC